MTPDYLHNGTLLRTFDHRRVVLLRGRRELYIYGDNAAARVAELMRTQSFNRLYTRARRGCTRNTAMLRLSAPASA